MKKLFLYTEIGCLLLATSCSNTPHTAETGRYNTMTMTAESRTLNQNYTAVITGRQCVEIRPQVSGTITEVCIEEGAKVTKGQTLFIIDQVPYKAALQTAVANVKSAEAAVATARMTASSKEELFNEHVVSAFDLQTARNQLLEAEAALEQAQAAEISARNDLSYTEVKSPVNGVASMIPYRVGALVSSSISEPLVTVSDDKEIYAYFSMAENQMLDMIQQYGSLEEACQKLPPVSLMMSNGKQYEEQGRIDAISGTVDQGTGSVTLRATFPNSKHLLRNGGSGIISVPTEHKNCIIIPQSATYELQNKVFTWKVVDGKTQSTQINIYKYNDGKSYIVLSGLNTGDIIIAEGAGLMREGTAVNTENTTQQ